MMIIRILLLIAATTFVSCSAMQGEDLSYPDLVCSELLAMDSTEQQKAIDWLNGKVAGNDTMKLEKLVNHPYSDTLDRCKAEPDSKVEDIIEHEH